VLEGLPAPPLSPHWSEVRHWRTQTRRPCSTAASLMDAALRRTQGRRSKVLSPDAFIVPLVGFDPQRSRLGYGGGYRDRTITAVAKWAYCVGCLLPRVKLSQS
jgi:5-formyltetrahydrofolate cyclo-ligase